VGETNLISITETINIPLSEIQFHFSPSRGPGGQHVNRAHTRATLLFDLAQSPSLDEETKAQLLHMLSNRLSKRGLLRVSVQESRSQVKNRRLALSRFVALLAEALEQDTPRIPTKLSRKADQERLADKKKHSRRKRDRSRDWSVDF
jgi:ribosome-associated protein